MKTRIGSRRWRWINRARHLIGRHEPTRNMHANYCTWCGKLDLR